MFSMLVFCFIMSITPGPNNLICMTQGLAYGYLKNISYMLGVMVGCFLLQLSMLFIGTRFFSGKDLLMDLVRYLGSVYLVYLAVHLFRARPFDPTKEVASKQLGFVQALVLQFMNPKAYIFNGTLIGGFLLPMNYPIGASLGVIFLTHLILIGTLSTWTLFGRLCLRLFGQHAGKLFPVMSLVLLFTAINLLISPH